jgi:hypothetical protein
MLRLYDQDPKTGLPGNSGSLFRRLAEFLWTRELSRQTRGWMPFEEAERRFARLAFRMLDEQQPTLIARRYAEQALEGEGLIHAGLRASILDGEGDGIRFYHQSMQECFAALELMHVGLEKRVERQQFKSGGWFTPTASGPIAGHWDEAVIAAAGLIEDPSAWIREVSARNIHLAARCASTVERIDVATAGSVLTALVNEHSQACDNVAQHEAHPPVDQPQMGQDAWEGWLSHLEGRRDYAAELIVSFTVAHSGVVQRLAAGDGEQAEAARRALVLNGAGRDDGG